MAGEAHLAELVKYDEEQTSAEMKSQPKQLYSHAAIGLLIGLAGLFMSFKNFSMIFIAVLGFAFFGWTFFEITMNERKETSFRPVQSVGTKKPVNYQLFHEPLRPHKIVPRTINTVIGLVSRNPQKHHERKLILRTIRGNPGKGLEDSYGLYKAAGGTETYESFLKELKTLRQRGLIKIKKVVEI